MKPNRVLRALSGLDEPLGRHDFIHPDSVAARVVLASARFGDQCHGQNRDSPALAGRTSTLHIRLRGEQVTNRRHFSYKREMKSLEIVSIV